jgi:hypothetical protein
MLKAKRHLKPRLKNQPLPNYQPKRSRSLKAKPKNLPPLRHTADPCMTDPSDASAAT